jgi:hypothetical protein
METKLMSEYANAYTALKACHNIIAYLSEQLLGVLCITIVFFLGVDC